jgi:uncharacterized ion transporter superfamily protein YfcC
VRAFDTSLIVFSMIIVAALLTWIVPAGAFEKQVLEVPGAGARDVVVAGTYSRLPDPSPQGIGAVLKAPIRGMVEAADIVAFVLLIGGAFAVLQATGAVDSGLRRLVTIARDSPAVERLILPGFMVLFSLGGAIFGMAEETIPFVLVFVPLARSLGYDAVVGVAIPVVGSQAGFAAAFLNPFTIGVAQGIADVPLFSGIAVRLVLWVLTTSIAIAFVTWYAARVRRDARASVLGEAHDGPGTASMDSTPRLEKRPLSGRHQGVLVAFGAGLVVLVAGVIRMGWYIEEIAALFVGLGIVVGVIARMAPGAIARSFMDGARDLVSTAVIIGLARGILVVLEDGQVIDTVLHAMAGALDGVGPIGSAHGMFALQTALNFFVPSGSGQAALTMPLMAPLADLVGLTRQVAVLAYQLGDGFTNLIIPTNPVLMGALTLGGVPWGRWARWMLPLQVVFFGVGLAALAIVVGFGLF